jgi:putative methylase
MALQRVRPFESPSAALEQYPTPATIAADILFAAYANGDIADRKVADLGCGTGMFAIGAFLLGASDSVGYDISASALAIARRNADELGADVRLVECDVSAVEEEADTAMMNPPFGCQHEHADRPFLEKAMGIAGSIYSIHMASTIDFVEEYAASHGREVVARATYKYNIPHTFSFHSRANQSVDVIVVNIR